MLTPRLVAGIVLAGLMLVVAGGVSGQDFPSRPIRIITSEPGSGSDFLARLIAQALTGALGKQVITENRGGGVLAAEIVLKASPDGYTLLLYGTSLWLAPFMREKLAYRDPLTEFTPVTLAASSPNVLVVHPALPVETVRDLIALARAKPGEFNYGSGSTGAPTHLAAELFKAMSRTEIVRIPYKGTGPAINALVGGQVQLMFVSPTAVAPHVKAGRLRALGVSSAQPTALAAGLPTIAATGLPGYESLTSFGVFAPARTPAALVNRLNREIVQSLNRPETRERLIAAGVDFVGSTPEAFAESIRSDMAKWGKLIKAAGIRDE